MLQQAQLAVDVMRGTLDQRRSSVRIHVPLPAEIVCPGSNDQRHPGLVRDISATGAYFFSNLTPEVGCEIALDFVFPTAGKRIKLTCQGVVVRVEPSARGGATGTAMAFRHYDLAVLY